MRSVHKRYVWNSGKSCDEDVDCGSNKCINKICIKTCDNENDCKLENSTSHPICKNNLCHYIKTGCRNNNDCPEGKNWTVGLKETVLRKGYNSRKLRQVTNEIAHNYIIFIML